MPWRLNHKDIYVINIEKVKKEKKKKRKKRKGEEKKLYKNKNIVVNNKKVFQNDSLKKITKYLRNNFILLSIY